MKPGEIITAPGSFTLNEGQDTTAVTVTNSGDRPVQVGSHYHFFETNSALIFDREASRGKRLDIPSGTAVRFEPGQSRDINLIDYRGARKVHGFNARIQGKLD